VKLEIERRSLALSTPLQSSYGAVAERDLLIVALTGEVSLESLPKATKATITTMSPNFFILPLTNPTTGSVGSVYRPLPTTTHCRLLQETAGIGQSSYQGGLQPWKTNALFINCLE